MTNAHPTDPTLSKITARGRGPKSHPCWAKNGRPWSMACHCPGSQNGFGIQALAKVCNGWERATCQG